MPDRIDRLKIPIIEIFKSIPGMFGIRLEEEPKFQIIRHEGSIEIRKYTKILLASVTVKGSRRDALDEGFHLLASYIFGKNRKSQKISMTNSVLRKETAETLAMTVPVFYEEKEDAWKVSFILPSKFDSSTAPEPVDERIWLEELPERIIAVLGYSGNNTDKKIREAKRELKKWLRGSGYHGNSEIFCAQYDQPFALPFLKRNEVQVDVTEKLKFENLNFQ